TVSKGLRENYVNKGYTEPYSMNRIYAASPTWGRKVTYFMNDLEKFAANHSAQNQVVSINRLQIAAVSGQLVLK
ncbi:MAG: hypothetical protein Q8Q91_02770, partial [Candidatus Daviesbacteria bacterium]|nr:hypothetical protein [Candidatus Daviesbacteria bacterium]